MRVAFDAERLRNLNSGLGQFCFAVGQALLAHRPSDADVRFIVPSGLEGTFGKGASYTAASWWQRYRAPGHADVWHASHQDAWIRPPGDARVVLSIMDLNFLERAEYSASKKARRLGAVQRWVDRASAITTISEYTATVVRTHLNIPDIPLRVVYLGNPVPGIATPLPPPTEPWLQELSTQPFFFFVGVIHPKKNVHVLLPALKKMRPFRLVIAGPNTHQYARELMEQARALGVDDRLVMPGAVDEPTKRWLYAHCIALLFPSLSEGFGLPVIEAMGAGKPVFLSRLTSLPEIGGPLAYYLDDFSPAGVATTVERGLADFDAHPDRPAQLREYASRFSWDRTATDYWSLYREVAQAPRR